MQGQNPVANDKDELVSPSKLLGSKASATRSTAADANEFLSTITVVGDEFEIDAGNPIQLQLVELGSQGVIDVEMVDTVWTGVVPTGSYTIHTARVNDVVVMVSLDRALSDAFPNVQLRFTGVQEFELKVVDFRSGHFIESIEVFPYYREWNPGSKLPDGRIRTSKSGESPVSHLIEGVDRPVKMRIESDGYGAREVFVPPFLKSMTVEMVAVGGLTITVVDSSSKESLKSLVLELTLEALPGELTPRGLVTAGGGGRDVSLLKQKVELGVPISFNGVAEGQYELVLRSWDNRSVGKEYYRGRVVVFAGNEINKEIIVDSLLDNGGSISVFVYGMQSDIESLADHKLFVMSESTMRPWKVRSVLGLGEFSEFGGDEIWTTDFSDVEPGVYKLMTIPSGISEVVRVVSNEKIEVFFDFSSRIEVSVSANASNLVDGQEISFACGYEEIDGAIGGVLNYEYQGGQSGGGVAIKCLPKPIWLMAYSGDIASKIQVYEGAGGEVSLTLDQPTTALQVHTMTADRIRPSWSRTAFELVGVGHNGQRVKTRFRPSGFIDLLQGSLQGGAILQVTRPGIYEFRYVDIRGEQKEERIEIEPGKDNEITID